MNNTEWKQQDSSTTSTGPLENFVHLVISSYRSNPSPESSSIFSSIMYPNAPYHLSTDHGPILLYSTCCLCFFLPHMRSLAVVRINLIEHSRHLELPFLPKLVVQDELRHKVRRIDTGRRTSTE